MVYPALLPMMLTPRLPVIDWTDAPADLNGLVRFAERRNLVSARVPSHTKHSLLPKRHYPPTRPHSVITRQTTVRILSDQVFRLVASFFLIECRPNRCVRKTFKATSQTKPLIFLFKYRCIFLSVKATIRPPLQYLQSKAKTKNTKLHRHEDLLNRVDRSPRLKDRTFWSYLVGPGLNSRSTDRRAAWYFSLFSFNLENCALLGYYAANSGNFLRKFWDNLSMPSPGFKNPKKANESWRP
jgi:hypothetical protein